MRIQVLLWLVAVTVALPRGAAADEVHTPVGVVDSSCSHQVPNGAAVNADTGNVTLDEALIAHYDPCAVSWQGTLPAGGTGPVSTDSTTSSSPPPPGPLICQQNGTSCSGGLQCCSGACVNAECCTWTSGTSCTQNSDCCSGVCNTYNNECGGSAWAMTATGFPSTISGMSQFDGLTVHFTVPAIPDNTTDTEWQFLWPGLENLFSGGGWESIIQPELTYIHGHTK